MDIVKILAAIDHTLLDTTATWQDIKNLCDEGIKYGVATVCIPPSYVVRARQYVGNKLAICTVIGFPNGYNTTGTKVAELRNAIMDGADEIDMVINLGLLKSGDTQAVEEEIKKLKAAAGDKILKVIVETCLLTEKEKIAMCRAVTNAEADFIKTSTGFSSGGATREDIKLFNENIGKNVRIKAAGGIKSLKNAEDFIELGASRLGTSSIIKVLKHQETGNY